MNFQPIRQLTLKEYSEECYRVYNKCIEQANGLPILMNYAYVNNPNTNAQYVWAVTMNLHDIEQSLSAIKRTIDMPNFIGWVFDMPPYWELQQMDPTINIQITQTQIMQLAAESARRLQMEGVQRADWVVLNPDASLYAEIEEDEHIANPQAFLAKHEQTREIE